MTWVPEISEVVGHFVDASNATLLARTAAGEQVVYKPTAGERPLWDFPVETLAAREVLTYEVSAALGCPIVPETVLGDGPYGEGAIQRFVDIDPTFDPVAVVQSGSPELWPFAVLDIVTNNADRKLGHLISDGERLLGIDHGLTFHPDDKLRTVLWGFSGQAIPDEMVTSLTRLEIALAGELGDRVEELLGTDERAALAARTSTLLAAPVHPDPPTDRPPLPWPPY
ncbi:MAG: SCO1664 family protein [bacterium]|nr:SCO1664 family protein [bacterium]